MRAAKVDDNQPAIVKALRAVGCSVQSLASIGKGCPDLLVGYRGVNYLIEVKDGAKCPSKQKLTPDEIDWHTTWRGNVHIVNSTDAALKIVFGGESK